MSSKDEKHLYFRKRRRIGGGERPPRKVKKVQKAEKNVVPRGRPSKLMQKYIEHYQIKYPTLNIKELRQRASKKIAKLEAYEAKQKAFDPLIPSSSTENINNFKNQAASSKNLLIEKNVVSSKNTSNLCRIEEFEYDTDDHEHQEENDDDDEDDDDDGDEDTDDEVDEEDQEEERNEDAHSEKKNLRAQEKPSTSKLNEKSFSRPMIPGTSSAYGKNILGNFPENLYDEEEEMEQEELLMEQLGLLTSKKLSENNDADDDDDDGAEDEGEEEDDEGPFEDEDEDDELGALIPLVTIRDSAKAVEVVETKEIKEKKAELLSLLESMNEKEYSRYIAYRRTRFMHSKVKRIILRSTGVRISDKMAILMAGMSKVMVCQALAQSLNYSAEIGENRGPLRPKHIREGYRRLVREQSDQQSKMPFAEYRAYL